MGATVWRSIVAAALCLFALPPASAQVGAGYTGVASCAGSTCHGRAEGNGAVVRQDEIATWQEASSSSGAHSRALAVLNGVRGRQIAATLGMGDPTGEPACLGCHATYAPAAERGPRFQLSEGVGCESCHGPAGSGMPAQYPRVSGQHADYTAAQLRAFRDGARKNNVQMTQVAAYLTEREIKAVSDYIAGLR